MTPRPITSECPNCRAEPGYLGEDCLWCAGEIAHLMQDELARARAARALGFSYAHLTRCLNEADDDPAPSAE